MTIPAININGVFVDRNKFCDIIGMLSSGQYDKAIKTIMMKDTYDKLTDQQDIDDSIIDLDVQLALLRT